MKIPANGFTHAGKFHADDVFATALLQILRPDSKITRGFNTSYRLKGSTLYDADGNEFTVVFHSTSEGDYTVTDQNGKDVTDDFKWLTDFFEMMS